MLWEGEANLYNSFFTYETTAHCDYADPAGCVWSLCWCKLDLESTWLLWILPGHWVINEICEKETVEGCAAHVIKLWPVRTKKDIIDKITITIYNKLPRDSQNLLSHKTIYNLFIKVIYMLLYH